MTNFIKKKEFLVFGFFLLLVGLFFYQFFLGLLPVPADIIVGVYRPWLDYKWGYAVGVPVHNPIISDVVSVIYPIKGLAVEILRTGQIPLWNERIFGGYPLIANFQLGLFFPTMLFYFLFSTPIAWSLQIMIQPLLSLIFMFLFLRNIKLSLGAAIIGSVVYGFGGFSMIWLEWNALSLSAAFFPLILYSFDKLLDNGQKKWGILLSFSVALHILAGYPQLVVFTLVAIALRFLIYFGLDLKRIIILSFYLILGILLSAIQLMPALELFTLSQRKTEIIDFNVLYLPWQNLIGFLVPDYFGNPSTFNFWGYGQYTLLTIYSGLTTFILSSLAFGGTRKKEIRFLVLLFFVSLIISLNNPLANFFHNLGLWGGQASSVTRVAFLTNFSLAALAAFGIDLYKMQKIKSILRPIIIICLIFGLIILGTLLAKYLYQQPFFLNHNQISSHIAQKMVDNLNTAFRNLILPGLILISVSSVLILGKIFKLNFRTIIILILLILIFELFRFGWKFNTFSQSQFLYPQTPITDYLSRYSNTRINGGDVMPENMWIPYGLSSYAGYDAVYPLVSAKFISLTNSNDPNATPASRYGTISNLNSPLFDLTGSKYLLALKRTAGGIVDEKGEIAYNYNLPQFKNVFEDKSVVVLENLNSLPNAFFVLNVLSLPEDQILIKLADKNISLKTQAFVSDSPFQFTSLGDSEKEVPQVNRISNSQVSIRTSNSQDGFLVLTDTFYPGWKAYIDGNETQIFRTNFSFRGVQVPKGIHQVNFVYRPLSLPVGALLSVLSLVVLLFANLKFKLVKKLI